MKLIKSNEIKRLNLATRGLNREFTFRVGVMYRAWVLTVRVNQGLNTWSRLLKVVESR